MDEKLNWMFSGTPQDSHQVCQFIVSSVCLLVRVIMVDKNKVVVCCLLATSAIMLSEKKKRKCKMWSKKWYLKRNISCDAHLLNGLLETDVLRWCHRGATVRDSALRPNKLGKFGVRFAKSGLHSVESRKAGSRTVSTAFMTFIVTFFCFDSRLQYLVNRMANKENKDSAEKP
jgi:hypothetical protein